MKKYITDSAGQPTELTQSFVIDSTGKQHGMTNIEFVTTDVIFKVDKSTAENKPFYIIVDVISTKTDYELIVPSFLTSFYANWDGTIHNEVIFVNEVRLNLFTNIDTIRGVTINASNTLIPGFSQYYNRMRVNFNRSWSFVTYLEFIRVFGIIEIAYQGLNNGNFGSCYNLRDFYIEKETSLVLTLPQGLFSGSNRLENFYVNHEPRNYTNNGEGIIVKSACFSGCLSLKTVTLKSKKYRSNIVSYGGLSHLIPSTVQVETEAFSGFNYVLELIDLGVVDNLTPVMYATGTLLFRYSNLPNLSIRLIGATMSNVASAIQATIGELKGYSISKLTSQTGLPYHIDKKLEVSDFYGPLTYSHVYNKPNLEEVIIYSDNFFGIGTNCFTNLPAFKKLVLYVHIPPTFTEGCFGGTTVKENITIYVPVGTIPAYEAAFGWSDFAGQYVEYIPEVYS